MARQKIARVLFWMLLGYTALSTTVVWSIQFGLIPISSFKPASEEKKQISSSAELPLSEATFTEKFVREYFLWTVGEDQAKIRQERLKPYLHKSVDGQAGLNIQDIQYNSHPQNVSVWEVKDHPKQKDMKDITVYVETLLVNAQKTEDQKRVSRYIVVSIKKAGNSYLVVDQPYITAPPVASSISLQPSQVPEGEVVAESVRNEIQSFLQSFWKVYTTGKPKEIAYYQKNQQPIHGLTGILSFTGLEAVSAIKVGDEYIVDCDVRFKDLILEAQISGHYQFKLVKEGDRFYVLQMEEGEI